MRPSIRLLAPALALAASLGGCQCGPGAAPSPAPPESASAAAASAAPDPSASAPPAAGAEAPPALRIVGLAQILVVYKGAELAPPGVTRAKADAQRRAEEALARLRDDKGTFEELAKQYSDDPTKVIGGAMGNYERSALPGELADAAFALEVGQTSAIIETARGFHILRRIR